VSVSSFLCPTLSYKERGNDTILHDDDDVSVRLEDSYLGQREHAVDPGCYLYDFFSRCFSLLLLSLALRCRAVTRRWNYTVQIVKYPYASCPWLVLFVCKKPAFLCRSGKNDDKISETTLLTELSPKDTIATLSKPSGRFVFRRKSFFGTSH
jgi:hypothetical protein